MKATYVRLGGLGFSVLYAVLIAWVYASQPQTVAEVTGGLTATIGVYRVDQQAFDDALAFFRKEQFEEARAAFQRADPAQRDATTQFYIAYSFYRQGWGRVYNDDVMFKLGLDAVERAIALAPGQRLVVDDANLGMRTGDELRAELMRGLTRDASDFNPMRLFRRRL
jgi:tetratricopeptide (TPR) repeat protein